MSRIAKPYLFWSGALGAVCSCHGVDGFIIVTSILWLVMGVGFGVGAIDGGRDVGT